MRALGPIAIALMICGCAPSRIAWQERRFTHQTATYYSELAHACDAVLRLRKIEPDELVEVYIDKSRLPGRITDLHPDRLWLGTSSLSIDFGGGNDGFWIGWGSDDARTNIWTLDANIQGSRKVFYSENR